ncbi:MAG TPA: hypothetical protein VHG28_24270 [Longimicrobiaceae bacterium]|nr:hypothetical protein [Longimicrobiaceae bacterium]
MRTTAPPVRDPRAPAPLVPSRPFGPSQPMAGASAAGRGHDFGRVAVSRSGPASAPSGQPIQMWPKWLDRLRGKTKEDPTEGLDESDRQKYHLSRAINEYEHRERETDSRRRANYDAERIGEVVSSSGTAKTQTALSPLSGALSVGGKAAETLSRTAVAAQSASMLGMAAPALGAPASLIDAGQNLENVARGHDKAKDKALMTGQAVSSLASATTTTASGMLQGANLGLSGFRAAAPIASAVAGPAAMVTGATDIVRGTVSGGLATYRRQKLKGIEEEGGDHTGIARFAKQAQTTKAVRGFGTAVGGGVAVAGGLGLLGLLGISNPVGWALLGGAAAVGGGLAAYKKYRQHQIGKQIRDNHEGYADQLRAAGIHVPTDQDLELKGWKAKLKNLFTTREARRAELVRGQIAEKLASSEESRYSHLTDPRGHLPRIIDHLGIRAPRREPSDESPLLGGRDSPERAKQKKRRIRDIGRVLEG